MRVIGRQIISRISAKRFESKIGIIQNNQLLLRNIYNSHRLSYYFSNDNKKKQSKQSTTKTTDNNQNTKQNQTKQQQIVSKQQQIFNLYLGLDKNHSFKNDLIVSQQKYKKQIKHLKQAILFEDLLKSEIDILIYDTNGKPFYNHLLRCLFMLISVFGTYFLFNAAVKQNPKFKVVMEKSTSGKIFVNVLKGVCAWLCLVIFWKHLKITKRFVQKVVYHTQTQKFTFTKRKFWGTKYNEQVSRFKILYTENPILNKKGTNYLNIENQNEYSIGYQFAWKKQDLFSHLISQRIKA